MTCSSFNIIEIHFDSLRCYQYERKRVVWYPQHLCSSCPLGNEIQPYNKKSQIETYIGLVDQLFLNNAHIYSASNSTYVLLRNH